MHNVHYLTDVYGSAVARDYDPVIPPAISIFALYSPALPAYFWISASRFSALAAPSLMLAVFCLMLVLHQHFKSEYNLSSFFASSASSVFICSSSFTTRWMGEGPLCEKVNELAAPSPNKGARESVRSMVLSGAATLRERDFPVPIYQYISGSGQGSYW